MFYKVLKNTVAAGQPVKTGDVVELGDDEGRALLNMGRVVVVDEPKKKAAPKRTTRVVTDLETPEGE